MSGPGGEASAGAAFGQMHKRDGKRQRERERERGAHIDPLVAPLPQCVLRPTKA